MESVAEVSEVYASIFRVLMFRVGEFLFLTVGTSGPSWPIETADRESCEAELVA
jgi:hypothetical protein